MLTRMLIIWAAANFGIVGLVSWIAGGWYLGWPVSPVRVMLAELGLIIVPNLVLPILALQYWWPEPVGSYRDALGWWWMGWRSLVAGVLGFVFSLVLFKAVEGLVGGSIPYHLPGGLAKGSL